MKVMLTQRGEVDTKDSTFPKFLSSIICKKFGKNIITAREELISDIK